MGTKKWTYGKDPHPTDWHKTSEILKANKPKKKKDKKNGEA